jgi:hypothetical protein
MKRAFVDVSLELLAQLLNFQGDVVVVHAEPRPELGALLRLHLRGDGLPEITNCLEGERSHQLTDVASLMKPTRLRPCPFCGHKDPTQYVVCGRCGVAWRPGTKCAAHAQRPLMHGYDPEMEWRRLQDELSREDTAAARR